jgi:NAD(P)-dependent dehydrogenase (short-subunit alcohol dehydrogenase family)
VLYPVFGLQVHRFIPFIVCFSSRCLVLLGVSSFIASPKKKTVKMSFKYNLDFTGKTVVVTGAAGGLGLVLAQAFYANNANVVITDIDDERLAAAPESFPLDVAAPSGSSTVLIDDTDPESIAKPNGSTNSTEQPKPKGGRVRGRLLAVKCDSSSEKEVAILMETVVGRFGELDVLINNAAVNDDMEPTGECGMSMWEKNIKVCRVPLILGVEAIGKG